MARRGGVVDTSALKRAHKKLLAQIEEAIELSLVEAGQDAQERVKDRATFERRSQSGSVRDLTKYRLLKTSSGRIVRISNNKMRGSYNVSKGLETGTRPHTIRAKNTTLRFKSGGRTMFAREVKHPGTKAYKFLFSAVNQAHAALGITLRRRLTALAKKF